MMVSGSPSEAERADTLRFRTNKTHNNDQAVAAALTCMKGIQK